MIGFAALGDYPQRERLFASCVLGDVYQPVREPIITHRSGNLGAYQYDGLVPPAPPGLPRLHHRTSATESGDQEVGGVVTEHAAVAVTLHALDLGAGQQGIRHESVITEHGVVSTHVCFDRPHSLFRQGSTIHPRRRAEVTDSRNGRVGLDVAIEALQRIKGGAYNDLDECRYCGSDFEEECPEDCPRTISLSALVRLSLQASEVTRDD